MTSGGQGVLSPTPETRRKISEHQTISDEQRERLRKLRTGQPPWCKGKKLPKRICKKISKARKGWKPTEETRKIWSEQRKGRRHSEETKRKMSEAQKRRYS